MKQILLLVLVVLASFFLLNNCKEENVATDDQFQTGPYARFDNNNEPTDEPTTEDGKVLYGNDFIQIVFDQPTGRIRQLTDLRKSPFLHLLNPALPRNHIPAFELRAITQLPGGKYYKVDTYPMPETTPKYSLRDGSLAIRWENPIPDPTVEVVWTAVPGEPELRMTAKVIPHDSSMFHDLRYPSLVGLAQLEGDGANDALLTTSEGGLLLFDPLDHLIEDGTLAPPNLKNQFFPDGHGAMAQMIAYLHEGLGGLLIYTADPDFHVKAFNVSDQTPVLPIITPRVGAIQIEHHNTDVLDEAGAGEFAVAYPTVLRLLDRGTWDEAAEIYRDWADDQIWAQSPIADRNPDERAFFEQLGASIFGLSSRVDQRPWIEEFHKELVNGLPDAKLLFVLGWDFHASGIPAPEYDPFAFYQAGWNQDYWVPFEGSTYDNIAQAQEQGDFVMPFYYDLAIHEKVPGWNGFNPSGTPPNEPGVPWIDHLLTDAQGLPGGFVTQMAHYPGRCMTLCPADPMVKDFWLWRDTLVQTHPEKPFDGLYFDLGFGVVGRECYDHLAGRDHDHPSGAGTWQIQAIRDALAVPRGSPNPRGYRYGGENAGEPFVDLVDFWHLGSYGDGPLRDKTFSAPENPVVLPGLSKWIIEGHAVQVPLMAYLYHHAGDVRTGGKMQISYEIGDAFYHIAAMNYIYGGVIELIYFNTGVDWLPGLDDYHDVCPELSPCAFQTGWSAAPLSDRGWTSGEEVRRADPDKLAFLRQAIALRVASPASPYLTMGRMEAPPRLDPEPDWVDFDYDYYSSIMGSYCYHSGVWAAQPILVSAWRHPYEDNVALLTANASDETLSVNLVADPQLYGMSEATIRFVDVTGNGDDYTIGAWSEGETDVTLELAPRSFAMIELVP